MLSSFQIDNFRLFQHLEVSRLSQVNLIVGQNNSGKSTFLEALEIYASNASASILLDLIEGRQETWFSEAQTHFKDFLGNPIKHLFFGHQLPSIGENGILMGEVGSHDNIHIYTAAFQSKIDAEGTVRSLRIPSFNVDDEISNLELFLVVDEGEKSRRLFRLDRDVRDIRPRTSTLYGRQEPEFKYLWQSVSTETMSNRKLSALWDLTSLTDLEPEIIAALRLIDNRVSGVAFVEDMSQGQGRDNRIPLVRIKEFNEPLPLKSMGDGITRLFHIVVALVNARNGLLLIDEFENGLHWSIQPKVWDIVFQLAEKLNVQVFATTHSRDCIEGFRNAWSQYPELGTFFRLGAKDGLIKATEYTSETLADAIDMDVEVR